MHPLALAPLSVLPLGPLEQIDAAAAAGYAMTGLRVVTVSPTDPEILPDRALQRRIGERLRATGVTLLDIEVFRIAPRLDVDALVPAMALGAELGAKHMLCTFPLRTEGTRDDEDATVESLVRVCERAATLGLRPMLEFMRFRLMASLHDAVRIVGKAAHPNLGICVDALHLSRSDGTPADLRDVDPALLRYCQLCDAPAASPPASEIAYEARYRRLAPGAGGLPLRELLAALPPGIPLSIEVPDASRVAPTAEGIARDLAVHTHALLKSTSGNTPRLQETR